MIKKTFVLGILFITSLMSSVMAYDGEYTLDKKYQERKSIASGQFGLSTRFGYGFNYDAFVYGASIFYHGNGLLGVTAGFDGYYIPNGYVLDKEGNKMKPNPLPLWNIRAGIMITKYFACGGIIGQPNVNEKYYNLEDLDYKSSALFCDIKTNTLYGGFVTVMLPVSKYFGFNLNFSVTNKMGFTASAGINIQMPLKQ